MIRGASRRLLSWCAAATALILLAACAHAPGGAVSSSAAGRPITLGLTYTPDIQFAPIYVAQQQGYFRDEGVSVTLRHHGASESLFGALQAGSEQVVFAGGDEMLVARGQGVDVVDFATIYQDYPVALIVPSDSPITDLASIKGHSIGVPGPFGENWYWLLAALRANGLSQSDIEVVNIGYTQQAALTGHKVDAVVGFVNNDLVHFEQAGFPVRALSLDPAQVPLVGVGLGASGAEVTQHSAELQGLWRAVAKGMQFCIDHPDQAVQLSAAFVPTLSQPDAKAAALATLQATTKLYGTDFGAQNPARWTAMSSLLAQTGITPTPVPADQAYTTAIVPLG